jgi:hypothetical protein
MKIPSIVKAERKGLLLSERQVSWSRSRGEILIEGRGPKAESKLMKPILKSKKMPAFYQSYPKLN